MFVEEIDEELVEEGPEDDDCGDDDEEDEEEDIWEAHNLDKKSMNILVCKLYDLFLLASLHRSV